jgi:hypothetical protein
MQQQNSPDVVPERDESSSASPPPLPPPSTNLPDFLKNFPSLKDTPGIQQNGWQLVVNDIKHVDSPYLKKLLTEWMIYEAKLDPMLLQLTGVCVCVCVCACICVCLYVCGWVCESGWCVGVRCAQHDMFRACARDTVHAQHAYISQHKTAPAEKQASQTGDKHKRAKLMRAPRDCLCLY